MRRLTVLAAILAVCFAVTVNAQEKNARPFKEPASDLPYKVTVSNIILGNQAYAQKVLWIYKYYEDNTLDKIAELLADDVVASFSDGTIVRGKVNLIKAYKEARNSFTSSKITVDACLTLKSPDVPDREAVSIWGSEMATTKDGSVIKMYGNEVYYFNNDGKVIEVRSMTAKVNQ